MKRYNRIPPVEMITNSADTVSNRAWLSIAVIVILMILSQIDRNSISLMVDPIRSSFQVNDSQIGLLQGPAFAVFFLLGSLLVGWLIDRYSRRWIIYIGVTIWSVATWASGFAGSFVALLIARSFVGLGESVLQPAAWNIIAKLFPARKLATAIGVLTAGAQAGVAGSFILVGFLMSDANQLNRLMFLGHVQPWQLVFIVTGLSGLLLGLLTFIIPREQRNSNTTTANRDFVGFVRENRAFLIHHFLGFGFLSIIVHGAAAWGPTYLMRAHGIDVKDIGLLVGLIVIPVGVGGAIIAGWLVDRAFQRGDRHAHFTHFAYRCAMIAVLGSIGFMFDAPLAFTLACFGMIQFMQPFSGVAGASLQIVTPERFRGRVSGFFIMFYNAVGLMFGPSFVALLSDSLGSGKLGVALGTSYLVFGAIAAWLLWSGRKHMAGALTRVAA